MKKDPRPRRLVSEAADKKGATATVTSRSPSIAQWQRLAILGGNCSDIDHNLRTVTHPCYKARVCDTDLFSPFVTVDRAQEEVGAPKRPNSLELCAEAGDGDERRIVGAFGASSEAKE